MRTGESQAADAGHRTNGAQELREIVRTVIVGIHRLTEQHDLAHAFGHHALHFTHDIRESAASFRAARERHDAISAAIVAAALHRDPCLDAIEALRLEVLVVLLEIEARGDGALAAASAFDEVGQRAIAVGADDQAHVLRLLEQLGTESLRHAPRDTDDRARLHVALDLAESPDDALLRVLPDRAGVHKNYVRAFRTFDRRIAMRRELAEHQLGVAHVHLAAVSLDVNGRHWTTGQEVGVAIN